MAEGNEGHNKGKVAEVPVNTDKNFKHIVRVANVDIPGEKKLRIALTKIKGVGINFASAICAAAGVDKEQTVGYLSDAHIKSLNQTLENMSAIPTWMYNRKKDYDTGKDMHLITGNLLFCKDNDIKRLKRLKTYVGLRHQRGLPVRGQRTRSNFRRNKGKVVGVKKKALTPTAAPAKGAAPAKAGKGEK